MSERMEICTTPGGRKRHLSQNLAAERGQAALVGRAGRTLCGLTGAIDQQRVGRQVAAQVMRPCKDITDMPPCRACYRAVGKPADETFHLTGDQLDALRALLGLVHYDDLAMSWLALLPIEFRSRGEQQ